MEGDLCGRDPPDPELFPFRGTACAFAVHARLFAFGVPRLPEDRAVRGVIDDMTFRCGGCCWGGDRTRNLFARACVIAPLSRRTRCLCGRR